VTAASAQCAACRSGAGADRDKDTLAEAYAGEPAISTETVDLTDETSIATLPSCWPNTWRHA
jgi:hypothetical protein